MHIAPDSMAGHLASYVGIPVITIYGSQNPDLTKPKNEYGRVIKLISNATIIENIVAM